ncbi:LPS assembly protein LptD [Devosia sp. MC1541]|uniref:LPS-assembly protein LptD n=1 Tax=Devosia sp. MC1541 TaxID=2725264 RepID=UPI00145EC32B|nr:LPS assembly protein LptD [Devosia sp. MC1541]
MKQARGKILERTALVLLAGIALAGVAPVYAQGLVPTNFFNSPVDPNAPTAVEAQQLTFNNTTNIIEARGDVVVRADGYVLTGDQLVYDRANGEMDVRGNVSLTDPFGNVSRSPTLKLTDKFKKAVLDSLTITNYDGSQITADHADYDQALKTVLDNAKYTPCGECVDDKGRRIGWSMHANKVTKDESDGSHAFEQPSLAVLGMPIAWLPYLWLPNLDMDWLPQPTVTFTDSHGVRIDAPFKAYSTASTDILLSPRLMSRQGFMLGAEWVQRFDNGRISVKATGLRQGDDSAFTFADAKREWRGALQTAGEFVPVEKWVVGFAYAAATDNAFYKDYDVEVRRASINEVYATHLTEDTYVDARVQQFNVLGDNLEQERQQQGMALPNLRLERTFDLPPGAGRVEVDGRMLNIYRERDYSTSANGVPYDYGYAGTRFHGMVEANWQNQYIFGGAAVTPFLGVRADAANYDGKSPSIHAPDEQTLFGLTPIAAVDVRYPLVSYNTGVTHLVEPIAQLVYRGAANSQPGITNEDSQSVMFDDSTLFSYNRFTGIDKQERGLRLNVGGRYMASLNDGSYLEVIGGQSYQLAGENAFAAANRQQVGVGTGLETDASYGVLGVYGALANQLKFGGKVQVDNADLSIARAGLGLSYAQDGWSGALNYRYAEATPLTGNIRDMHEVGAEVRVPIADYWSVTSNAYWDLSANSFLQVGGGLQYDDGYVLIGGQITRTGPTHSTANDMRAVATFRLRSPAGFNLGYSGNVQLPGVAQ